MSAGFRARQRARLESWAASLEQSVRGEIDWLRIWIGLCAVLFALVAVLAWAPGLRDFFGLRPAMPVTALVLAQSVMLMSIVLGDRPAPFSLALVAVIASFCFQLFASSLVVQSDPPGAFALAVLPVMMAAFAGLILRAGPAFPWVAVSEALAIGVALLLRPDAPHLGLFVVIGPVAVGSCLLLGGQVERLDRERSLSERQHSAIQAQVLEERAADVRRLAATLTEIAGRTRDASAALAAAARASEELAAAQRVDSGEANERLADSLRRSLARVQQALEETRQIGRAPELGDEGLAAAGVAPVVRAVVEEAKRRFPRVAVRAREGASPADGATAVLRGGAESLRHVLESLVANACEGDGGDAAREVEVTVEAQPHLGALAVRVCDDGPGFRAALLARPITPFLSTKAHGTGLGLYTAERLVRASGGSLRRENLAERGAAVTIYLEQVRSGERPAGLGAPALAHLDAASAADPASSPPELTVQILESYYRAQLAHDKDAMRPLLHADYRVEQNGSLVLLGVEAALERADRLHEAFPDLRVEVNDRVVRGHHVVERWTMYATHLGAFLGIPASRRPVAVSGVTWVTLRDGRVAKVTHFWDTAALHAPEAG
jgi:steroid delta-isomerase-like uncharacterized protein